VDDLEKIEDAKDRLANQRAKLDQREKMFEDQYPMMHPRINLMRLHDLEVWRFNIEIDEWELEEK
jgi:hypothetical protein